MVNTQELHQKLNKYFLQNINNPTQFTYTLAAILRGEHLNEN